MPIIENENKEQPSDEHLHTQNMMLNLRQSLEDLMKDDLNGLNKAQAKTSKPLQFDSDEGRDDDLDFALNVDNVDKTDAADWDNIKSPEEKSSHQSSQSEKEKIKSIMEIRGQLKLKKKSSNKSDSQAILSPSLEPSQMTREQVLALLQKQVNSPLLKPPKK